MIYSTHLTNETEAPDILFEASDSVFERIKAIFQKFIDFIDRLYKNLKYNIYLKGSHYRKYKSFIDHGFKQIYTTKNIKCKIDFLVFEEVKDYLMSTESCINSDMLDIDYFKDNSIATIDFDINNFIGEFNPRNADDLLSFTTTDFARDILNYFDNLKIKCKRLLSKLNGLEEAKFKTKDDNIIDVSIYNMVKNTIDVCTKCYKFTINQVKIANSICDDCIKVAKDELKKNGKYELTYDDSTTTESVNLGIFEDIKFI